MNSSDYPTLWQRRTMWSALTALALATIGGIAVGLVWTAAQVISFLQPILIPFAVAGVLAYLLDPVVSKMVAWGIPRRPSVLMVFALVSALLLWGAIWFVPAISHQTVNLLHRVDDYTRTTRSRVIELGKSLRQKYGFDVLPTLDDSPDDVTNDAPNNAPNDTSEVKRAEVVKNAPEKPDGAGSEGVKSAKNGNSLEELIDVQKILKGDWLKSSLTALVNNSIRMIRSSVGGFLSVFGFLLSLIIIPIYLFYFLIDARNISESWQDYLPLRASQFKDEVVSSLTEINGYIIAFFRGQLLVSVINGTATALGLVIVGLDFGLLIGLVLCVLGLIPYLGILVCWIPAVIIATVQEGTGTFIPSDPGWLFPVVVTGIFVLVQKIDSFFITPKVVASRVGLHPLTVIVSLFMWSLLIGGLLGTILAVPLTATLKVLLRRYVWERRILRAAQQAAADVPESAIEPSANKLSEK
jgi:predicted PurR-regulated permease PerM